jgi:hypothetical protein
MAEGVEHALMGQHAAGERDLDTGVGKGIGHSVSSLFLALAGQGEHRFAIRQGNV